MECSTLRLLGIDCLVDLILKSPIYSTRPRQQEISYFIRLIAAQLGFSTKHLKGHS